jgi:retron-type reverse transcriptase
MKRLNCLFEQIADYQNLRLAFLKAIKGKRSSPEVLLFCGNVDKNLETIRDRFLSPPVQWGAYQQFTIKDPKERIISAAPIDDRIMHHAIMNVLEGIFERQMIYHTYACRKEKGQHGAVLYAFSKCKAAGYFLKMDIRRYFDSIDHRELKNQIQKLIKDSGVLYLLDGSIDSYHKTPGKGVPIGNLTSQFFANLYLSKLDHYVLEQLRPFAYVRYMDDFVLWADDKQTLRSMLEKITAFASAELRLQTKPPIIGNTVNGLPFLGFKIKKQGIYLLGKSKRRMAARVRDIQRGLRKGAVTEEQAAGSLVSVYAAVNLARTRPLRVRLWYGNR